METKVIKEWSETAKQDAKRFFKEKDILIADYIKSKLEYYFLREERKARFKARGVDDDGINERMELYNEVFWKSFNWWQKKNKEYAEVMTEYKPIFDKAEAIAKAIDVSDIKDGFPCGGVDIYLKDEKSPLGKALRSQFDGDSYGAKVCYWSAYRLPVKIPSYGQCISFDERICGKVAEFLNSKGMKVGLHSWID